MDYDEETIMSEIENELLPEATGEPKDNTLVRFFSKYTLDGVVVVRRTEVRVQSDLPEVAKCSTYDEEAPLEVIPFEEPPKGFNMTHHSELAIFHSLVQTIRKNRPRRTVPVTRTELIRAGADPKIARKLVEFGYLQEEIIPFMREDGSNIGSRACVFYTPKGRAYIQAKIDPSYLRVKETTNVQQ